MVYLGKQVVLTIGVFTALALTFTVLSLYVSPSAAEVGTARSVSTIPAHEIELGTAGVVLGVFALRIYGKGGIAVALMLPALVILLDLDHLPSFLGLAQPIRPAHSLVFLAVDMAITTIILRRLDFGLVMMSGFFGHLGVDSGLIPPFSPFSFLYVQIDEYHAPLLVASIITAFAAGHLMRVRRGII